MIYLDHNATSPLLPEALEAMRPWLGVPANPASAHQAGQRAAVAVEEARAHVAALVGGDPAGVVFTSGATEANHTALRGLFGARRVAVGAVEHPCVLAAADVLAAQGVRVDRLGAGRDGRVRLDDVPHDIDALCLMAANHETGVLQDLDGAREICRRLGASLHVDATQAAGRVALRLGDVHSVALSSHKIGGPGGVGALVLPDGEPYPALLTGGSQERGRRAGTVHTAGVVGFGEAARIALKDMEARRSRWARQSTRLRAGLIALGARLVGDPDRLLTNTTTVVFAGIPGELLVQALDLAGICASSGAACASGSLEPSPVLRAMGDPEPAGAVRFSLGPSTEDREIDGLLERLPGVLTAARGASFV